MNLFYEAKQVLDKDGKVNPLGPYGKMKLTGQEVASYFRKNKVSDPKVKKAVEVALDLGGAYDVARKEIAKFFGDKILKSKEVQTALKYANESFTLNQTLNQISEENLVEKNLMPDIQKIVDTKGAAKVGGIMIDMFTASMISQIYDKVNDSNKKKMENSNISTLVNLAQKMMQKNSVQEGTMAIGIFDRNPSEKKKAIAGMQKLLKGKQNVKVGSPEGRKIGDELDMKYLSDDELADDFMKSSNKNMTISQLLKKHEKRLGLNFKEEVEKKEEIDEGKYSEYSDLLLMKARIIDKEGPKSNKLPAVDDAIRIAKKKLGIKESVIDSYRKMWEDAVELDEEVANITVDPKNRINSGQQQGYHGMEIAKQARRFGLKSAVMHKHVRIKGAKKAVNDFLRIVIGKSTYGDPTEKDMSTPQIDKMLTKGLK